MASCPGGPERKPKRRFRGPFSGIHTSAYGPENSPVPWPHHLIEIIVTLKSALQGQIPTGPIFLDVISVSSNHSPSSPQQYSRSNE